jgi:hypothetical protein
MDGPFPTFPCHPPSHDQFTLFPKTPQRHKGEKVMVFFITCAAVDYFTALLQRHPAFRGVLGGGRSGSASGPGGSGGNSRWVGGWVGLVDGGKWC